MNPDSIFWWKIVMICHIACPKWMKTEYFRGFFRLRVEIPGFKVKILKMNFHGGYVMSVLMKKINIAPKTHCDICY